MGISKKLWMAQQELDEINERIEMNEIDFEDVFCFPKDIKKLNHQKKSAEEDVQQLTDLAQGFGLINNS